MVYIRCLEIYGVTDVGEYCKLHFMPTGIPVHTYEKVIREVVFSKCINNKSVKLLL